MSTHNWKDSLSQTYSLLKSVEKDLGVDFDSLDKPLDELYVDGFDSEQVSKILVKTYALIICSSFCFVTLIKNIDY